MTYTMQFLDGIGSAASDFGPEDSAEGANTNHILSEVTSGLA